MQKNAALPTMMLTLLLDFIGLFMVIPLFAPLLLNPHNHMVAASTPLWLRTTLVGLLIASYGFGQLWGGPLLGELSDQYGRKKIISIGLVCLIIANLLGVWAFYWNSLILLFLCRFGTGFASGNGSVIFAAINHMASDRKEASLQMGYLAGACSIGAVLGPVVGSSLAALPAVPWPSLASPFLMMSFAFAINLWMLRKYYRDDGQYQRRGLHVFIGFKNIVECFQSPALSLLLIAYFLFVLSTESIFAGLPIFAVQKFQVSSLWLGHLFALGSACSAISSFIINRQLAKFINSQQVVIISTVIICVAFFMFLLIDHAGELFLPYALVGFTCVLIWAHFNLIFGEVAAEHIQGKVIGVAQSLISIATLLGPAVIGFLMAKHPNTLLLATAVPAFCSLLIFLIWSRRRISAA